MRLFICPLRGLCHKSFDALLMPLAYPHMLPCTCAPYLCQTCSKLAEPAWQCTSLMVNMIAKRKLHFPTRHAHKEHAHPGPHLHVLWRSHGESALGLNEIRWFQTDKDRQTDSQTNKQTDRQTERRTDKQTDRQTDRQASRQAGRQTGRQAGRQTN